MIGDENKKADFKTTPKQKKSPFTNDSMATGGSRSPAILARTPPILTNRRDFVKRGKVFVCYCVLLCAIVAWNDRCNGHCSVPISVSCKPVSQ